MHMKMLGTELNFSSAIFGCVRNRCAIQWLEDVKVWWRIGPVALYCASVSLPYIHIIFVFLLEQLFRLLSWSMILLWSLTWALELLSSRGHFYLDICASSCHHENPGLGTLLINMVNWAVTPLLPGCLCVYHVSTLPLNWSIIVNMHIF